MKRLFLLCIAVILSATAVEAQNSIRGTVIDESTGEGIIGAVIQLRSQQDTTRIKTAVSGYAGNLSLSSVSPGNYDLIITFLGYQPLKQSIEMGRSKLVLDTLRLKPGIELESVVKEAVAIRTTQNGDTLIYNADAYKVTQDADVEGLLKKMPGIQVENGQVQAQGETVQKIFVDGKEFFSNDVSTAIKSLPAETVKSIEVFNKLSDNAEFSGMDDGEGYKAINITTREGARIGQFGKFYGGYAFEPGQNGQKDQHYGIIGGTANIFMQDHRLSLNGLLNNMGQRNANVQDILDVGDDFSDGHSKIGSGGFNYNGDFKDKLKVNVGYMFSAQEHTNWRETQKEFYELTGEDYRESLSANNSKNIRSNHSMNTRIEWDINETQRLHIRANASYQSFRNNRDGYTLRLPFDPLEIDTALTDTWSKRNNFGWNTSMNINYMIRLGKPGRILILNANGSYNTNNRENETYSNLQRTSLPDSIVRQLRPNESYNYTIRGGITYMEPISPSSQLSLQYNIRYNYSDGDQRAYDFDTITGTYYSNFNPLYSNITNSNYIRHNIGPGYLFNKNGTNISASINYQRSTLANTRVYPTSYNLDHSFNNLTYTVVARIKFTPTNRLHLFWGSSTQNPGIQQLQDVLDITDPLNISSGNSGLRPSYDHRIFARYTRSNVEKGRTLMLYIGGTLTQDYISTFTISNAEGYPILNPDGTVYHLERGSSYSRPINLDGNWVVNSRIEYGFPLNFMKCNLNLRAGVSYRQTPTQNGTYNDLNELIITDNTSRNLNFNGGVSLGSNISENVDFYIAYNASYNQIHNTQLATQNKQNNYFQHNASANFKVVLPLGFTIAANATYTQYLGLSGSSLNNQYILCNASIGKKIFRNQRGEINITANDIFNQNQSYSRTWGSKAITTTISDVMGRYFGINLFYNLRNFGKKGSKDEGMYETLDGPPHMRPGGGRPGGGFGGGRPMHGPM